MAVGISPSATSRILADLTQRNPTTRRQVDENDESLEWKEYDPKELPDDLRQMNDDRREANRLAGELAARFKDEINKRLRAHKAIGADQTMLFSFKYGKLRGAVIDTADVRQPKTKKPAAVFGFKRS